VEEIPLIFRKLSHNWLLGFYRSWLVIVCIMSSSAIGLSMESGGNHLGSPHADVLSVVINETTSAHQRETLYLELQRRSKAAVEAEQWPDAVTLYKKALECCATTQTPDENPRQHQLPSTRATLHANISLCLGKMSRWTEAIAHAKQAAEIDLTYVKGWYRLGQARNAVKEYKEAILAFEKALNIEPQNTVLMKELDKAKTALESQPKEDEAAQKGEIPDAATEATSTVNVTSKSQTKLMDNDVEITFTDTTKVGKDDLNTDGFTKSDHVKGYKIVNGKKTSYFHNELSEDAAKLIGDIAPKKLDPVVAELTSTHATEQGTSAWNKAGTWEEKDCTAWAFDTITEQLMKLTYTLPSSSPAPNGVLSISKVDLQKGSHASVAAVRGKKRYIYELDITIHWNFLHDTLSAAGTMRFPDVDGTCALGDGYDATEFTVVQIDDPTLQPVLTQFCYRQGLRLQIHEAIDNWVRQFKDAY
jgi:tetratricopeptide (TPR) repeat protein